MCVPGCTEAVHNMLSRRGFMRTGAAAAAGFAATAATPALARAKRPRQFTSVLDLTHTMSPDFPTFFGVPGIEMQKQFDRKKDGFNLYWWRIVEHAGTHIDAPIHFSEDGATVDKMSADEFVLPLAVIDVSGKAARDADYEVSRQEVADWEKRHGRLPERCCVAMHSGWGSRVAEAAKFTGKDAGGVFHFPGFAPATTEWLLRERRVAALAVDTLSLDHGPSKDFRTHNQWLPAGRWGIENIANLDRVPPSGATLVAGLPKIKDATGGPARIFALV